jgi:polyhydroxybutyrate depolymerase
MLVEAPELVTAATLIGTNLPTEEFTNASYADLQARPVMFINGTADRIVPYEGGTVRLFYLLNFGDVYSASETVDHWVAASGQRHAPDSSIIDTVDDGTSIELMRWHEPGKAEVRAYRVNGGDHTIPMPARGSDCPEHLKTSHDMDSVEEAWSFFRRNSRQPGMLEVH